MNIEFIWPADGKGDDFPERKAVILRGALVQINDVLLMVNKLLEVGL